MPNNIFNTLFMQNILLYIYPVLPFLIIILGVIVLFFFLVLKGRNRKKNQPELRMTSYVIRKTRYQNSIPKSIKVAELNRDLEPFGFAYYPPQDIFYSNMVCWQRECGYCEFYDEASAAFSMIIDCEPIYFDYEGKKWLIEFWKGQYGLNTGCEIGVYTTTGPNLNIPGVFNGTFYYTAAEEDQLILGFSLYKDEKKLLYRKEKHWWLTGFKLGEFSEPSELVMEVEITLKSSDMCIVFVEALKKNGYTDEDIQINNTTVSLVYDKPHYEQPSTRTPFLESFMQANNKRNCQAYQLATKPYDNTLDKLNYVKYQAPKMYRKILNVGSTKEVFAGFDVVKKYLNRYALNTQSINNINEELQSEEEKKHISN
jgi:hypothetical protein